MRNTKLIVAMLAGCMAFGGAAMAQDAATKPAPTPASTAGSQTHTSNDSMKSDGSMSSDSKAADANGSMKSTHKKHKKAATTTGTEPAKSSSSGM
jgi:hypothetical protein